ncbi:MAG: ABC transporter ATP-binding protein [Clostridiales bacterium]|nr:ABC transporter ATP-binding protein [Clostridiales bacterium]
MEYKENAEYVMEARDLTFSYDGKVNVLEHLDVKFLKGKITVLLGANGCGKSTLFKLLTKNLYPDEGRVNLYGEDLEEYSLKEFARNVAIVHQNNTAPPDRKVETLVGYGRTPYLNAFQTAGSKEDEETIRWAMEVTHVDSYRNRPVSELSGGQRQRVWIAMALAMMTDILFLDEPCNSLDIRYQIGIMKLVRQLNREYGMTIIMILHDINQAMTYADVLIGMKDGRIIAEGEPQEIVTPEMIRTLYGIELPVTQIDGRKYVLAV